MKYFYIIFLLLSMLRMSGQIVYHEFNPPIEIYVDEMGGNTSDYLYLDLNDDGTYDLQFILSYWYSFWTPSYDEGFSSKLYTQHQFCSQNDMCNVVSLVTGDTIWNNIDWNNSIGSGSLMYKDGLGCNNFNFFKYIGLKLKLDNNYFFGWINVKTFYYLNGYEPGSYAKLLVSDYAINSESGLGLIAGDTVTSLISTSIEKPHINSYFRIYPNPVSNWLIVESEINYDQISLINTLGQEVYREYDSEKTKKINCSHLNSGVYILKLITVKQIFTKKILIDHK